MLNQIYIFNYKFYITFYQDLKEITKYDDALNHYLKHGKKENRVCCKEELIYRININTELINKQIETLKLINYKKEEEKINILIRTSMRPEYFNVCINSIIEQVYSNYNIIVCYDNINCIDYLNLYDYKNLNKYFIQINNPKKYKFNLYNNFLMDLVDDGFIIFLDDDDMFSNKYVLKIINENITNNDEILIWKFMRPDKLIYPRNVYNIKLGDIDTTSVCFHSKYKNNYRWWDEKCGDFNFFTNLFNTIHNLKIQKINYILTKTIYLDKKSSSE